MPDIVVGAKSLSLSFMCVLYLGILCCLCTHPCQFGPSLNLSLPYHCHVTIISGDISLDKPDICGLTQEFFSVGKKSQVGVSIGRK